MDTTRLPIESTIVSTPFTINLVRFKAAQLCRRSDFSRSDDDDLRQKMLTHLWTKSHLFDPSRGNLEVFVTVVINPWIAMELRRRARLKRCEEYSALSLDGALIEQDGDAVPLSAVISGADLCRRTHAAALDPIEQIDLKDAIERALSKLTVQERDLLAHVAKHGVADAARKRCVSRRQIDKAIARMRARFEDAGLGDD